MVNSYSKELMLKGGLMMDSNSNNILDKHPAIQKRITEFYLNNIKHIRETMLKVLGRSLDSMENDRLRKHSFKLAVQQVALDFRENIGMSKEDLQEMYDSLTQTELLQFFNDGIVNIQEDKD